MNEDLSRRIRSARARAKVVSAQEAAKLVRPNAAVGTSGFNVVGSPKAVPLAVAQRGQTGEQLNLTLITGASVGDELDGAWARAGIVRRRYPYQASPDMRRLINEDKVAYCDLHLSQVPFWLRQGYLGHVDLAIVEAAAIDEWGNIIPTASVGCTNALVECADRVIVEVNLTQPAGLEGMHDIYSLAPPPGTKPIPITHPGDRIGTPYIPCPPEKLAAVVLSDIPEHPNPMPQPDKCSEKIAGHLIRFLTEEVAAGRLPYPLPPLQSGVGGVANAVLAGLCRSKFEHLTLYSEVLQDSVLDLIDCGKVDCASACSLSIGPENQARWLANLKRYKEKIVLRPQEISNSPEVIRRLGVISINTAVVADLCGNVNSTHIGGTRVLNGIGGSGDFARNAALTIFTTPSTALMGTLSCIMPTISHIDHTEHDVQVIITEEGVADLRGLTPFERANLLINQCAHPSFREELSNHIVWNYCNHKAKHGTEYLRPWGYHRVQNLDDFFVEL